MNVQNILWFLRNLWPITCPCFVLFTLELKPFHNLLVAVRHAVDSLRFLSKSFSNSRAF